MQVPKHLFLNVISFTMLLYTFACISSQNIKIVAELDIMTIHCIFKENNFYFDATTAELLK